MAGIAATLACLPGEEDPALCVWMLSLHSFTDMRCLLPFFAEILFFRSSSSIGSMGGKTTHIILRDYFKNLGVGGLEWLVVHK